MFFHHYYVDGLRVSEGKKAEAPGAPAGAISHDCAFLDFAECRKVIFERF